MWLFGSPIVNPEHQKDGLSGDHIRAAFSMPFIYPPARIGDDYFSEGADHQPINFHTCGMGVSARSCCSTCWRTSKTCSCEHRAISGTRT